jgi:hypothetical protein
LNVGALLVANLTPWLATRLIACTIIQVRGGVAYGNGLACFTSSSVAIAGDEGGISAFDQHFVAR